MQKIGWTWRQGVLNLLRILVQGIIETKDIIARFFIDKSVPSTYVHDISMIQKLLSEGRLKVGDNITFIARYSNLVPCFSLSKLFPELPVITEEFSLPLRMPKIFDLYLNALYDKSASNIYDKNMILISQKQVSEFIHSTSNITGVAKVTGTVVYISQTLIDLMKPTYIVDMFNRCLPFGIVLHEVEVAEMREAFYSDLWRLDLFPFLGPEESMYEFWEIQPPNERWPRVGEKILSYLTQIPQAFSFIRKINSFAIVPKINVENSTELMRGRELLLNFYTEMFHRSSIFKWIPRWKIGHGIELEENYAKAQTIFQYDQSDPVIPQTINFDKMINELGTKIGK